MENIEKRTLMRTVFAKLKAYLASRQNKYRLKLRSNVHLRLKRSKKSFSALFGNIRLAQRKKTLLKQAEGFRIKKIKHFTILGFKINLVRVAEKCKNNFKALCFFKHSNMFRSFLSWKNLKSFVWKDELKKQKAGILYFASLKKRVFRLLQIAKMNSQKNREVRKELMSKTR